MPSSLIIAHIEKHTLANISDDITKNYFLKFNNYCDFGECPYSWEKHSKIFKGDLSWYFPTPCQKYIFRKKNMKEKERVHANVRKH